MSEFRAWSLYFPDEGAFYLIPAYHPDLESSRNVIRLIPLLKDHLNDAAFLAEDTNDRFLLSISQLETAGFEKNFIITNAGNLLNSVGVALWEVLTQAEPRKISIGIIGYDDLTPLKELKSSMLGRMVSVKGTVARMGPVKPIVESMSFQCHKCFKSVVIPFKDGKFKLPSKCPSFNCKSKSFTPQREHPESKYTDCQVIRLQELNFEDEQEAGRVPRTIECVLKDDLIATVNPGTLLKITGIVRAETEDIKNTMYVLYIDVIFLQNLSVSNIVELKESDWEVIRALAKQESILSMLVHSFCPVIYGHEMIKAGILLSLFAGSTDEQSSARRRNVHVLVVGDPGMGKSQILSSVVHLSPRSSYVCGNSTTSAGLTVAFNHEPGSADFTMDAGALVMADQGACCIDELDKITDHKVLLEAMEQECVSVAKAGLVCTLPARTSVIAAANPVSGHYK